MILNLPNPEQFIAGFMSMAWQQILIWSAAASGALLAIYIIKALSNKS